MRTSVPALSSSWVGQQARSDFCFSWPTCCEGSGRGVVYMNPLGGPAASEPGSPLSRPSSLTPSRRALAAPVPSAPARHAAAYAQHLPGSQPCLGE